MTIQIDHDRARQRLQDAIAWANDIERPVPEEWVMVTETVAAGTSKTFIAGLGTALVAKATDARVDPLAIKPEPSRWRSFALRPLCERVVVPASRGGPHPPFHLGSRRDQPTNNQPYFRYSHLDDVVRHRAGDTLDYLRDRLRELDELDEDAALAALAAYVRSRTEVERAYREIVASSLPTNEGVHELLDGLESFLDDDRATDRPLRLQAVVGGLVRSIGPSVSTQGITDPSRHAPGDVHVPDADAPTWVAEVKGRRVSMHEAVAFLDKAREYGVPGVWIVVLSEVHKPLDREELSAAARSHGLLLVVVESIVELVAAVLSHPGVDPTSVKDAAAAVAQQLRDMQATGETLSAWAGEFAPS